MKTFRWARARVANFREEGERGASLVLALAFLSLFGVFIVALLGFASTAFLTTTGVHEQGLRQYAASSAVDTAIQRVRPERDMGRDPIFGGPACNLSYPAVGDSPAVEVSCTGQPNSGDVQPNVDAPINAILTLGTGGENGFEVAKNGTMYVQGPIYSNSNIALTQASPVLDATDYPVTAEGPCTPDPASAPNQWLNGEIRCNYTGDSDGEDPNFASRAAELPSPLGAPNPAPTCPANNATLRYSPGYYTNASLLENPNFAGCANSRRYFAPGVYYFDFDFDPAFASNSVWTMTGSVIGGTPKGWNPNTPGSAPQTIPDRTIAPLNCDATAAGVQFIFGGASQVEVEGNANVELCASSLGGPGGRITIYGQKTGTATPASAGPLRATAATATPATWGPTANVLPISPNPSPIDGVLTTPYTIPPTNPASSATMSMSGFPAVSIPAGSAGKLVTVRVAHRETIPGGPDPVDTLQLKIGTCTVDVPVRTTLTTDTITSATFPCLESAIASTFTVDYVATARQNRSFAVELDGVEVNAEWTPPVLRQQSGCVAQVGGCPFISFPTGSGNHPRFYQWGTAYAPLAFVYANFKNNASIAFDRGVVLRALKVEDVPSADTYGSFRLGSGGRLVEFIATVDGVRRVRALVRFVDTSIPGRTARIVRWSVSR